MRNRRQSTPDHDTMDFSWTVNQLKFRTKVIQFARKELNADLVSRDRDGLFQKENWKKCAEFGIQGRAMPEEFGGSNADIMTALLMMEALGFGCRDIGLTFGLNAQMWTVQLPILNFGTKQQKKKYLPNFCSGTLIGAHAITEPESGSDVFSLSTRAEKKGNSYVINGSKKFVTLGPVADVALVFATINPELGKWGITAFLIDRETPGYHISPIQEKMGLRTMPMCELTFKNCVVPAENRLGPEGAGISISNSSLEWERCCILASQIGAMERQLETCVNYARKRLQFNEPIGKFQSVSNRIADMKLRLETSRLILYKAAWLKKSGKPAMMEAALSKLYLSECFAQSSLDAIRIHGGNGYMSDYEVERDLRDAVGGVIYGGTSDIQRNIVASLLGV